MGREGGVEFVQPPGELVLVASRIREGIALVRDDRVHWASPRLEELLVSTGPPPVVVGQNVGDLLDVAPSWVQDVRAGQRMTWPDGNPRLQVECAGRVPAPGDAESEVWIFGPVTDEPGQQTRGSALDDLDRELDQLRGQAQRSLRQRDELIALLSHELRTPLTVIAGYSKLLLSGRVGELSSEQRRCLLQSSLGCDRLNAFVSDLLETSCEDPELLGVNLGDRDLCQTVEQVVTFHQPLLEERNLSVAVAVQADLPAARCDEMRIEQVLTNLLGNAIKYTKSGSRIDLMLGEVLEADRRMIEVAIVDDGPGIAEEDRDRIFEAYVRSDCGDGMSGVGLGLAICRRIMEAHRGDICVRGEPGRGSRFAFRLPLAETSIDPGSG